MKKIAVHSWAFFTSQPRLNFCDAQQQPALEVLQQEIADVVAEDGVAIIAGNFNARTGCASSTCQEDSADILDVSLQPGPADQFILP